jgi:hypothetical protein
MRKLNEDINASAVPIILFVVTLLVCGALYTLFFIEVGFPLFNNPEYLPDSDTKTLIMMGIYGLPLIIVVVGVFCMIKAGQKRHIGGVR